ARDDARAVRELEDAGATVVVLASVTPDQVLADLARRQVQSLLVEGGGTVTSAFVTAGCFDRVAVDVAPRLIGGSGAPGPLGGDGIDSLAASPFLDHLRIRRRGGDLIIEGFRAGCLQDLSGSVAS
ncbi:MAG: dihydrofolate reductase family protein, partial [Acidobacteriota bacterium]